MRIAEINRMATVVELSDYASCGGVHESVLRAYNIVNKVRDLLKRGVPADVILELIDEMEAP